MITYSQAKAIYTKHQAVAAAERKYGETQDDSDFANLDALEASFGQFLADLSEGRAEYDEGSVEEGISGSMKLGRDNR